MLMHDCLCTFIELVNVVGIWDHGVGSWDRGVGT